MTSLGRQLLNEIPQATFRKTVEVGLANAKDNLPYIKRTIAELDPGKTGTTTDTAMVISAGPSLHTKNPASILQEHQFNGPLIVADGALGYCLRNGLIPEYVVSVDPHPTRIVRWFGDPALEEQNQDEYFLRQEMDPAMHRDGMEWNRRLIEMVNEHGPKMKAIIATSAPSSVRDRCIQAGMELYWWNPMYDDYDQPDSWSRRIYELTRVPCMVTGGNVGTSAWVFGAGVLKAKNMVLAGMDLGYPPDNPITNTQYYTELVDLFGDRVSEAFIKSYNPHLHETWYTDPTYYWYREGFLELARQAQCTTYNCTEGGVLFGEGIKFMKLEKFLKQHAKDKISG